MNQQQKKGFTLIELLVVIAIISLLSSVVLASLNTARMKAQDAVRTSDMKQIMTALTLYYNDNGKFPCHSYQNSADTSNNYLEPLITGGYLTRPPHDPTENPLVGQYYDYWSFKTSPGGTCGAIAHLGFKIKSGAACPANSVGTTIPGHCHIFSEPLDCDDPYLTNDSSNFASLPLDCQRLADGYTGLGTWNGWEDDW